jgi:hypothetical protein
MCVIFAKKEKRKEIIIEKKGFLKEKIQKIKRILGSVALDLAGSPLFFARCSPSSPTPICSA